MPLSEINVDCWNTSKGETQSTVHFTPIDELKASASTRLSHSHVISGHPGFDACLSVGSMIVNFKHNIEDSNQRPPTEPASDLIRTDSKNVGRDLSEKIASELVDQNKLEADYKFQLLNPDANLTNQVDDGSIHKFASIQFNDIVICEFCNKKVWKNLILILGFKKFKPNLK